MKKVGIALALSMALTAISGAQGGPGRGGFRAMQGMGKMMEYFNLRRGDVQTDLKLTDDQKSKLTAAQEDMQGKMRDAFTSGGGTDPEAMQATMKKLSDEMVTALKAIITPEQQKRLDEINVQLQGGNVLADPDMQKTLNLTADQLKQIKDLQDKQNEANASLMEKVQNGDIDRQEVGPMMQKNREALGVAMEKVLTDDQRAQLKKLGGAPFVRDPKDDQAGFGFGRRPAGGGN